MKQLTIILFLLCCSAVARAETVVISTGEYPPYNSESFTHFGLMPRIITEAFKSQGIEAVYQFYPWARAYEMSKAGKVDATAHWYFSEERVADHFYSDTLIEETAVWFHLKGTSFDWARLEDLGKYRIGAVRGYTYTKRFYELIQSGVLEVEFVSDDEQNYRKLLLGRIDAVPEVVDIGLYLLHTHYPPTTVAAVTQHPKAFFKATTHLLFPRGKRGSERLRDIFNKGLEYLRRRELIEKFTLESRQGLYMPRP